MKKIYAIGFFLAFVCLAQGQQTAQYSLPQLNKFQFNPAYAGMDYSLSVTAVNRRQWSGIYRTPETQSFNAHMPLYIASGGVGIKFENDILGSIRNLKLGLAYSYVMQFDRGILSIGLGAGIHQFTLNGTELRANGGFYEGNIIDHNDPRIPNTKESDLQPNLELGLYYIGDRFEGGVAISNIGPIEFNLPTPNGDLKIANKPVGYAQAEYLVFIGDQVDFVPSLLFSTDLNSYQLSGLMSFLIAGRITIGAGWRGFNGNSLDAAIVTAGYKLNEHFDVHYAYDIGLSELASTSSGSHEIIIKYNLNKKIGAGSLPKIIYNPRYL